MTNLRAKLPKGNRAMSEILNVNLIKAGNAITPVETPAAILVKNLNHMAVETLSEIAVATLDCITVEMGHKTLAIAVAVEIVPHRAVNTFLRRITVTPAHRHVDVSNKPKYIRQYLNN